MLAAAEKKAKRQAEVRSSAPANPATVNDSNVVDYFKSGEDLLKKGRNDEALRAFQGVYDYTKDNLTLLKCVKTAYDKAYNGQGLDQNQREDLYVKLQRIGALTAQYSGLKTESAFRIGLIYKTKGNPEQARKYLLEACQTAPFSLDPASVWMKAKNLLLTISGLEGEF